MKDTVTLEAILKARCTTLPLLIVLAATPTLGADLHDPMRPPMRSSATGQVAAPELKLEAILVDHDRRIAIVDGKVVREGDRVSGALITAIGEHFIQYTRDGRSRSAQLRRAASSDAVRKYGRRGEGT